MNRNWLGWAAAAAVAGVSARVAARAVAPSLHAYAGQTVLVTGASGGIGEAVARLLAEHRARLVLAARSEEALDRLAEEFRGLGAETHVFVQDLAEPGAAEALVRRVHAAGLTVDVLVNNAGYGKAGPFASHDAATYEDMIRLNCGALTALTRLLLPAMVGRGHGGVLNVASTAGFQPVPRFAVYAATKAYVRSFSEALHAEVAGSGVRVTCLCPGATATGFFDRALGAAPARFTRSVERPEDVARKGLDALLRNERVLVTAPHRAVAAAATRFVPTPITMAVAEHLMQEDGET